jgi:hypothetical protein
LNDEKGNPTGFFYGSSQTDNLLGPPVSDRRHWCIWVNTFRNKSHDTLKWRCFVVSGDFRPILRALEVQALMINDRGEVVGEYDKLETLSRSTLRMSALDGNSQPVTTRESLVVAGFYESRAWSGNKDYGIQADARLPFVRHFVCRRLNGTVCESSSYMSKTHLLEDSFFKGMQANAEQENPELALTATMYVSPLFLTYKEESYGRMPNAIVYSPTQMLRMEFPVSLEELNEIKGLQATVSNVSR